MNKYVIYTEGNEVRKSYTVSENTLEEAKEKVRFHLAIRYFNDDTEITVYGGKRID